MKPIDESAFDELVGDALDELPERLGQLLDNVVILIEDEHPTEDLLGLYEAYSETMVRHLRKKPHEVAAGAGADEHAVRRLAAANRHLIRGQGPRGSACPWRG